MVKLQRRVVLKICMATSLWESSLVIACYKMPSGLSLLASCMPDWSPFFWVRIGTCLVLRIIQPSATLRLARAWINLLSAQSDASS